MEFHGNPWNSLESMKFLFQQYFCNSSIATVVLQQYCCNSTVATVVLQQYCCNNSVATVLLQQYCCNSTVATVLGPVRSNAIPVVTSGNPVVSSGKYEACSTSGSSETGRLTRDPQVVSLEITDFRLTTTPRSGLAGPEPKFLSKFILGPEPDTAPYVFFFSAHDPPIKKNDFISRFFQAKTSQGTPQNTP